MRNYFFALAAIILVTFGCTKDDICEETAPTTPRLVIEFKDNLNRDEVKAVNALQVLINDVDSTEVFVSTLATDTLISIPLNTEALFSEFQFVLNSNDTINTNTDLLTFTYSREDVYINRACAFRVTYNDLNPMLTDDPDNWILDTAILKTTIEDETEVHLTIFH